MKFLITTLAACLLGPIAYADEVALVESSSPVVQHYKGHAIDVLGISPGMTPDAAKKPISEAYPDGPQITIGSLSTQYRGSTIKSKDYPVRIWSSKDNNTDIINVYLGTPATGNVVVGISRQVNFPDVAKAPTVDGIIKSLEVKYGSATGIDRQHGNYITVEWVYDKDKVGRCCFDADPDVQLNELQNYEEAMSQGFWVVVEAIISPSQSASNPGRVSSFWVQVGDNALKVQTLSQALKQLQEKALQGQPGAEAPPGPKL